MLEEITLENFEHWALSRLLNMGVAEGLAKWLLLFIDITLILIISAIAAFLMRRVVLVIVGHIVRRSKNPYDDILYERKVFSALGNIVPAIIVKWSIPYVFHYFPETIIVIERMITIYIIIMVMIVVNKFLRAVEEIAYSVKYFEGKPVRSFIQVFVIINLIFGTIVILSLIVGKNPLNILGAFGALSAVLLIVFKDTILGLVASVQISANDMVRIGDWVSMDKYGADGDVTEINLNTVKVRNWDKTITTIPTYAFISDSFKNWRGMQAIGARRIMRAINIDLNSVRFVDKKMLEEFSRFYLIHDFLDRRQKEIDNYNTENKFDRSVLINGRNMTNLGVFRAYIQAYLENHPKIHKEQAIMVRQREAKETGLQLEIYCFTNDIVWANYESIQSDIFDHLFAAIEYFHLRVFQNPSGHDFRESFGGKTVIGNQ